MFVFRPEHQLDRTHTSRLAHWRIPDRPLAKSLRVVLFTCGRKVKRPINTNTPQGIIFISIHQYQLTLLLSQSSYSSQRCRHLLFPSLSFISLSLSSIVRHVRSSGIYIVIDICLTVSFVPSVMALPFTIPPDSKSPVSFDHQTLSMKITEEAVVHIVPSSNGCDVTCMHISAREPVSFPFS